MRLIPEQYVTGILPHKMQGPSRLAPRLELRDEGQSAPTNSARCGWEGPAGSCHSFGQRPLRDGVLAHLPRPRSY
jgi:hypothetical protein